MITTYKQHWLNGHRHVVSKWNDNTSLFWHQQTLWPYRYWVSVQFGVQLDELERVTHQWSQQHSVCSRSHENSAQSVSSSVSVGMRRGFAPHFRHLDDLFAPNMCVPGEALTLSTILFRSCWVPFRSPPFSFQHVDDLFRPPWIQRPVVGLECIHWAWSAATARWGQGH